MKPTKNSLKNSKPPNLYRVVVEKRVRTKDLPNIPVKTRLKIVEAIGMLAHNPRPANSIKLTNREEYRLRVGSYRILYIVDDNIITVLVVKVAHRKDAYK